MKQFDKKEKITANVILALLIFSLCAGCGKDKKNTVTGKWYSETNGLSYYMVLDEDGTGGMNVGGISFILEYNTEDDRIIFEVDGDFYLSRYSFSENGKILTLKNLFGAGRDIVFTSSN